MIILTIRSDKPEAEIGLFQDSSQLAYQTWSAHRQLGLTIHNKILDLLKSQKKDWKDIQGVVCFKGPGSFTGLRIGLSVGNTLAMSNNLPIVATASEDWIQIGIQRLLKGDNEKAAVPNYGAEAFTTKPKK
ncbi:MAG: hypothetical protein JWS12_112 [Candidatus Saccharibacteria bacterium]|nr:hypothetical protein [Candidatus Saccharibacteria bacterium]